MFSLNFIMCSLLVSVISGTPLKHDKAAANEDGREALDCDIFLTDLLKSDISKRSISSSEIEALNAEYELACITYLIDALSQDEEGTKQGAHDDEKMVRNTRRTKSSRFGKNKTQRFWKRNIKQNNKQQNKQFWFWK